MNEALQPFSLKIQGADLEDAVVERENLHKVFSLVERRRIEQPLEVFQGDRRVGRLRRSPRGIWVIGWHSSGD